jgi:hypothetical protein
MPLAEVAGVVAVLVEDVGDGPLAGGQRALVARDAVVRVAAGDQRSTKGGSRAESPRHDW